MTSSLVFVPALTVGCQSQHDAVSAPREPASYSMSDIASVSIPIRGHNGSKLTTLFAFAGTGDNEGQMYVWLNRARTTVKSDMDIWYPSSKALVDALTSGQSKSFDVWAGGTDVAARVASNNGVSIRPLTNDEIARLSDAINR